MLQKSAELGCQGLFFHISTCLISACCEKDCCGQAVVSRVRASVSSEQWPVGALSTRILEGQVCWSECAFWILCRVCSQGRHSAEGALLR